jgi:hypothetical protein
VPLTVADTVFPGMDESSPQPLTALANKQIINTQEGKVKVLVIA